MRKGTRNNFIEVYLLSIFIVICMILLSVYVWILNPGSGGLHEETLGNFLTVFAVPILLTLILIVLPLLIRHEPRKLHILQSKKALTNIWGILLVFFSLIQSIMLLSYLGREPGIATYWPLLAGLVCVVMGNYMGKIRSNTLAGIRTPWTLSSELSWNKTHRLGGRLLFLLGIMMLIGPVIVTGEFWAYFILAASICWTVALVVYSYFIWKKDPNRKSIKSTLMT